MNEKPLFRQVRFFETEEKLNLWLKTNYEVIKIKRIKPILNDFNVKFNDKGSGFGTKTETDLKYNLGWYVDFEREFDSILS